jgi:nicotinamide-nucleotide amidase
MRAAILAVGSELLGVDRVDSNSLRLTETLNRHGIELAGKAVIGDDEERIATAVGRLLADAELLLVTGGLGPTADDRTRQGVAAALGRGLRRDEAVVAEIRDKFARLGRAMPEVNVRQADVIEGAEWLANPRGTAPGMRILAEGRTIFLFPGVPRELEGMIDEGLEPWLAAQGGQPPPATRTLRVACLPESEIEERLAPVYARFGDAGVGLLPAPGDVELRLTARGPGAEAELAAMTELARACLGRAVYSEEVGGSLEAVVGRLLSEAGATLATAESCTGGLVAERLTRVPGSSAYFAGAIVAYDNRAKASLLGVAGDLIERHGAVSREVAEAMALGCQERFGTQWAVAVTGVAGPAGGSAEKPVGTVHHAIVGPAGARRHEQRRFPGDRRMIRRLASQWALDLLRRELSA